MSKIPKKNSEVQS